MPSPEAKPQVPTPQWHDPLASISVSAPEPSWTLSPIAERGGQAGVVMRVAGQCRGRLVRTRISGGKKAAGDAALAERLDAHLDDLGVTSRVIRDEGVVAHGDARALMREVEGQRTGRPFFSRLTATFLTRSSGRFYVLLEALSEADDFVTRRTCFDAIVASMTLPSELR